MASFKYLWINRAKFPIGSNKFFRAWGKRFFSLNELLGRNKKRSQLVSKGAIINETAEIGETDIQGKINLLSIGNNSFLGRVKIALHEQVEIGKNVCINDGVEILTASHDVYDPEWMEYFLYPRLCVQIGKEENNPSLKERVTHVLIVEGKGYEKLHYEVPMNMRPKEDVLPIDLPQTQKPQ